MDALIREKNNMELGKITVTGGLSEKSIQELMKKHIRSFNLCYRQALKKQPDLKGKVVFKIVIDPTGRVIKVNMSGGTKKESEFKRCTLQELKKLRFPAAKGEKRGVVTITFILKPA
jgi:TonB family protein